MMLETMEKLAALSVIDQSPSELSVLSTGMNELIFTIHEYIPFAWPRDMQT